MHTVIRPHKQTHAPYLSRCCGGGGPGGSFSFEKSGKKVRSFEQCLFSLTFSVSAWMYACVFVCVAGKNVQETSSKGTLAWTALWRVKNIRPVLAFGKKTICTNWKKPKFFLNHQNYIWQIRPIRDPIIFYLGLKYYCRFRCPLFSLLFTKYLIV